MPRLAQNDFNSALEGRQQKTCKTSFVPGNKTERSMGTMKLLRVLSARIGRRTDYNQVLFGYGGALQGPNLCSLRQNRKKGIDTQLTGKSSEAQALKKGHLGQGISLTIEEKKVL